MMLRQLQRLHQREEGVALIVSLMVAFVVLMLSTVVVGQSIHSLEASGYERQRLTSINAAEAGTNDWWQYLETTPLTSIDCDDRTDDLASAPAESSYTATATFYRSDATSTVACPLTNADLPAFVRIESTGTSEGEAVRTMETYVTLKPVYSGFGAAIMAQNAPTSSFSNSFQVNGQSGNDGDIYILNGPLTITNSPVIYGNVYVPNGTASISNSTDIKGELWAKGTVTMNNPAKVSGNAKSTTGNIVGSGSVVGDATALGSVTVSSVGGTRYASTNPGPVPTQTFPQITSSTTPFTNAGYTPKTFSGASACTEAYNFLMNTGASTWQADPVDTVIRIAQTCTMTNDPNDTITIRANLAIVSDGGFNLKLRSDWNGVAAPVKAVQFISAYTAAACTGTKNISVSNNTNFDAFTNVFFYTPCTATMSNTNNFAGQVLAGTVSISNQFTMTYKPVLVPGYGDVEGFDQSISYVREI